MGLFKKIAKKAANSAVLAGVVSTLVASSLPVSKANANTDFLNSLLDSGKSMIVETLENIILGDPTPNYDGRDVVYLLDPPSKTIETQVIKKPQKKRIQEPVKFDLTQIPPSYDTLPENEGEIKPVMLAALDPQLEIPKAANIVLEPIIIPETKIQVNKVEDEVEKGRIFKLPPRKPKHEFVRAGDYGSLSKIAHSFTGDWDYSLLLEANSNIDNPDIIDANLPIRIPLSWSQMKASQNSSLDEILDEPVIEPEVVAKQTNESVVEVPKIDLKSKTKVELPVTSKSDKTPRVGVVKKAEWLGPFSKRLCGSGEFWPLIAEENNLEYNSNGNPIVHEGMELKLPKMCDGTPNAYLKISKISRGYTLEECKDMVKETANDNDFCAEIKPEDDMKAFDRFFSLETGATYKANRGVNPRNLQAGRYLIIPDNNNPFGMGADPKENNKILVGEKNADGSWKRKPLTGKQVWELRKLMKSQYSANNRERRQFANRLDIFIGAYRPGRTETDIQESIAQHRPNTINATNDSRHTRPEHLTLVNMLETNADNIMAEGGDSGMSQLTAHHYKDTDLNPFVPEHDAILANKYMESNFEGIEDLIKIRNKQGRLQDNLSLSEELALFQYTAGHHSDLRLAIVAAKKEGKLNFDAIMGHMPDNSHTQRGIKYVAKANKLWEDKVIPAIAQIEREKGTNRVAYAN